jgi:hypothetical protein
MKALDDEQGVITSALNSTAGVLLLTCEFELVGIFSTRHVI